MSVRNKSEYHHGDLYESCLRAARAQIKSEGIENLSLREIARELGVSPAAPYRHFPTKNHLLAAVATKGFSELTEKIKGHCRADMRLSQVLHFMGKEYVKFALSDRSRYWLMFGRVPLDRKIFKELKRAEDLTFYTFISILSKSDEMNSLSVTTLEKRGIFIWSSIHGFTSLLLDEKLKARGVPFSEVFEFIAEISEMLTRALRNAQ